MASANFTVDFGFVDNDTLRLLLAEYHREALTAFGHSLYAATIILCGGVVEGTLTWALQKMETARSASGPSQPKDVTRLRLEELIDKATKLGLLGRTAKDASWAVKDFRNYIHPYNVLRGGSRCDAALATSALSAVVEIVRSLRGRVPNSSPAGRPARADKQHNSDTMPDDTVSMQALNFCWLVPGKLAGCRGPRTKQDLRALAALGIRAIVRLADRPEAAVNTRQVEEAGLQDCHEPVPDFCAPDFSQVDRALSFVEASLAAGKPVAISCGAGYGRTSTLLACYLVRQSLTALDAIREVKSKCQREPERPIQKNLIEAFADRVRG